MVMISEEAHPSFWPVQKAQVRLMCSVQLI